MVRPSGQFSTEEIIAAVSKLSLPEIEEVFDHVLILQGAVCMVISTTVDSELEELSLITGVSKSDHIRAAIAQYVNTSLAVRPTNIALDEPLTHLSPAESELLVRAGAGLPADLVGRLVTLRDRRERGTITDEEYEELTQLGDQAEDLHADRLAALVELARLRGVSLPSLLDQLGISFPDNV